MQVKCLCVVTRRDLLLVCGRVYCPAVRTKKTPLMDKISIAWVTCGIPWWNTTCTGTDTVYVSTQTTSSHMGSVSFIASLRLEQNPTAEFLRDFLDFFRRTKFTGGW